MRKVILDVDTGTDDAVAIMFAALHPEIDLLAVTTVNGNVPLANTTDNTLRVLDWIGRPEIPVYPGLPRPIVRDGFPGGVHFEPDSPEDPHGSALPLPEPRTAAQRTGAVEYLLHTLRTAPDPITLVAVGPLSNLAAAVAIDPSLTEAVDELVIMGGGHATANVTASAEFNIWADPEAAHSVFAAGFPHLTLVTLDATHQALITRDACTRLAALATPSGEAAARLITHRIDAYETAGTTQAAAPVHDVVCTAYLVQPTVITTQAYPVTIETSSPVTVGRTIIDTRPDTPAHPNAQVALKANPTTLLDQLLKTFTHT
ncbi:MAG TPA: nucleoside hydrolase [Streptosporangiaceae bacterium]|jgi:purine nucleosidase/ribosylpyrimidine nucleosidase